MRNDVSLVVLMPSGNVAGLRDRPGTDLLGISLIDRTIHVAQRSGIARLFVVCKPGACPSIEAGGIPVEVVEEGALTLDSIAGTVIVMRGDVLADTKWLKALIADSAASGGCLVETDVVAVLAPDAGSVWLDRPVAFGGAEALFAAIDASECRQLPPDPAGRFIIESTGDDDAAEDWLLQRLIKSGDSFLTRTINRPLSLALTRRLARTRVTPNQVTLFSVLVGLVSAPFFLSMDPMMQVTGALILLTHNVIDGCDGELARLKFQMSHRGLILDLWGDNVVHAVLFACMGVGWSVQSGMSWPLAVAGVAVGGTLWTAWLVFRRTVAATRPGTTPQFLSVAENADTRLSRVLANLGNRDFLFGVFALALFGKAQWLLPLVAAGSPLFAVGLTVLNRREGR